MAAFVNTGKSASGTAAGRPSDCRKSGRKDMSALEKYRILRETRKVVRRQRIEEEQRLQHSS